MTETNTHAHMADVDEAGVIVATDVDPSLVEEVARDDGLWGAYEGSAWLMPVRRALSQWAEDVKASGRRNRSIFARDKFVTPNKIFEQMAMAEEAMDDDVVGSVYDISEAMAFKKMTMESDDPDQANVWNQIAADLDLDSFLRVMWRELFKNSNYFGVIWWGTKTYKVKGQTMERVEPPPPPSTQDPNTPIPPRPPRQMPKMGRPRRKEFTINVPIGVGVLDPTRVVPVGLDLFGNYRLAWIADREDFEKWTSQDNESVQRSDDLVSQLFVGPYRPSEKEKRKLANEGIPTETLMELNRENVWWGHLTKATYERWARVRMKSIFPLLDMKHQLREMDRAFLLGGINFIVLVRKGTEQHPVTKQSEITMVAEQMRAQAKSSVIVSDHRLEIDIITPDIEHILSDDKWATLDERIRARLWGTIAPPATTGNRENQVTLAKVVALGLENRRHMLKRDIERYIVGQVKARNPGEFDEDASLEYAPRRIDLMFDPQVVTLFQELRDRGDLSRETTLDEFGFDQDLEAQRRKYEYESGLDDIFGPVNVPFDSPNKISPGGSGRQGGRPPGSPGGSPAPGDPEQ